MRKDEKKRDITEVLEEFLMKIEVFDKELKRLELPYIQIANETLGKVVAQTIKEIKEYIEQSQDRNKGGRNYKYPAFSETG